MDDKDRLILSIILVIVSAFSLNTLTRLYSASKEYPTNLAFEDATHISLTYAKYGRVLMALVLLFSLWTTFRELKVV
jgi:hypothetical protein